MKGTGREMVEAWVRVRSASGLKVKWEVGVRFCLDFGLSEGYG